MEYNILNGDPLAYSFPKQKLKEILLLSEKVLLVRKDQPFPTNVCAR